MRDVLTAAREELGAVLAVLGAGAILGLLAGFVFDGSGGTRTVTGSAAVPAVVSTAGRSADSPESAAATVDPAAHAPAYVQQWKGPLGDALQQGAELAEFKGGFVAAAIWVDGWSEPIVAGDNAERVGRLWSMSKPVATIALLEALEARGEHPSHNLTTAIHWAVTASDNCAMRYIELQLQDVAGSDSAALSLFQGVLHQAGIYRTVTVTPAPDTPGTCNQPLPWGPIEPALSSLQFGTYTWQIRDAVAFAHALIDGVYGDAGRLVARQMRLAKQYAPSSSPADYTAPLDEPPSGGNVFPAGWHPGYKGGWGGSTQDDFVAGQIVILNIAGVRIGLAAEFWPTVEPSSDDPGKTVAPQALEDLFKNVSVKLHQLEAQQ